MRARDVVGKTVARLVQERRRASSGEVVHSVERIVFTDGSSLLLTVVETEGDYAISGRTGPRSAPPDSSRPAT